MSNNFVLGRHVTHTYITEARGKEVNWYLELKRSSSWFWQYYLGVLLRSGLIHLKQKVFSSWLHALQEIQEKYFWDWNPLLA